MKQIKAPYYIFLLLCVACSYQSDRMDQLQTSNKFENQTLKKIREWQDRRQTDSLINAIELYPDYLSDVAFALASVQDNKAIPALSSLLSHKNTEVRQKAAFALGQTYDTAAFQPLVKELANEDVPQVMVYWLEALGKVVPESQLNEFLKFTPSSQEESEGYASGLYRAGLRGIFNESTTRTEVNILDTARSKEAKIAAAHYLARVPIDYIPSYAFKVLNKQYADPEVRMAVALTFNKTPPLVAINRLKYLLNDEDYRVRVNAVRAIPEYKINDYVIFLDTLLLDVNINTAVAAAEKIVSSTTYLNSSHIDQWLKKKPLNWRVEALLLQAAIKKDPGNGSRIEQAKKAFLSSNKPYRKAALLSAFSYTLRAHEFLVTETFKATHPAVSTSGMEALVQLMSSEDFPDALKPAFTDILRLAISSGDPAMVDIASRALRNPDLAFKDDIKDPEFLRLARQKFQLPKHNETLQSLEKTIAFFENRTPRPVVNDFNHPINWDKLSSLHGRHKATIKTEKGEIEIVLFTNIAPGTVVNFVELAQRGYYNNKVFHRVVPNFVAQAGGSRGDGWGNEEYSIRTEFSDLKFTTGSIGMASAGKDTEGTQWFITHSPTPHLEGIYTIFARVEKGMDVVHQLEQGDFIYNVTIK